MAWLTLCVVGNLCEKSETPGATQIRESCGDLTSYLNALTNPTCTNPGTFTWTPDSDTPDLVYYQVGEYFDTTLLLVYLLIFPSLHNIQLLSALKCYI